MAEQSAKAVGAIQLALPVVVPPYSLHSAGVMQIAFVKAIAFAALVAA